MEPARAHLVRQVIANHAHRIIFSASQQEDIPTFRPRIVSAEQYKAESDAWERWHLQQMSIEEMYLGCHSSLLVGLQDGRQ